MKEIYLSSARNVGLPQLGALTYLFALAMLLLNLRYCSLAVRVLMLPRFFLCIAAVDVISIAPAVFVLGSSRCQQE
eukprot:1642493-Prymnesium_polylepis.1